MTTVRRHGSDDKERARQIVENGFQTIFFADARAKNGVVFDNEANRFMKTFGVLTQAEMRRDNDLSVAKCFLILHHIVFTVVQLLGNPNGDRLKGPHGLLSSMTTVVIEFGNFLIEYHRNRQSFRSIATKKTDKHCLEQFCTKLEYIRAVVALEIAKEMTCSLQTSPTIPNDSRNQPITPSGSNTGENIVITWFENLEHSTQLEATSDDIHYVMIRESPKAEGPIYVRNLTNLVKLEKSYPSDGGSYADIWEGVLHDGFLDQKVAIKALRVRQDYQHKMPKLKKRLRELMVWTYLEHPNIVPLLGLSLSHSPYASMVSPWYEKGNVHRYLETFGDIIGISDRLRLLSDVAAGLSYLHSCFVVHGDLTGPNILIDDDCCARLADFGLSNIISEVYGAAYFTSIVGGAVRWAAPELYQASDESFAAPLDFRSDISSFGSVAFEILSGKLPYHGVGNMQTALLVCQGTRPRREESVATTHWEFIESCWAAPPERPVIGEVCKRIKGFQERVSGDGM